MRHRSPFKVVNSIRSTCNLQLEDFYLTRPPLDFICSLSGQRIATEVAAVDEEKLSSNFPLENKYSAARLIYSVAECVRTFNENRPALTHFPEFLASSIEVKRKFLSPV